MATSQPPQILVVEDNEDDNTLLTHQLVKAHMKEHVTLISDGREALDYLVKTPVPPSAIFLDLQLPGLSGIELLKKIREEDRLKAVPVIIMTSTIGPTEIKECSRLGVNDYLPKPVNVSAFVEIVGRSLK